MDIINTNNSKNYKISLHILVHRIMKTLPMHIHMLFRACSTSCLHLLSIFKVAAAHESWFQYVDSGIRNLEVKMWKRGLRLGATNNTRNRYQTTLSRSRCGCSNVAALGKQNHRASSSLGNENSGALVGLVERSCASTTSGWSFESGKDLERADSGNVCEHAAARIKATVIRYDFHNYCFIIRMWAPQCTHNGVQQALDS